MRPIFNILNADNINIFRSIQSSSKRFEFIYADMIYENKDLTWMELYTTLMKDNGVFIVQTDYHTCAEVKLLGESLGLNLLNWCIYVNDWGGVPNKGFPRKHDDILIFTKTDEFKWYPERIQIPKATAGTALDKKGTGMKTPPDVFYDKPSFSTVAKERIKFGSTNIRWQKPKWLMERLLLPFTDIGDYVLDVFMGSATLGDVCIQNGRNYLGIESDPEVYEIVKRRILL